MKKSTMLLSVLFAGTCALAPVSDFMPNGLTIVNAAQTSVATDAANVTADDADVATDVEPVEVASFKNADGETVTVVTFSDATVAVSVGDNAPVTGAAATAMMADMGITMTVANTGAITNVVTAPTVEVVQAPVAASAVTDASVAAAVVAAAETVKTETVDAVVSGAAGGKEVATDAAEEVAAEANDVAAEASDAMDSSDDMDSTDSADSSDSANSPASDSSDAATSAAPDAADSSDTATSTAPSSPSLGANTSAGSSAGSSLSPADDVVTEIPDIQDSSSTTK